MPQIGRIWATLGVDATTFEAGFKQAQKSMRRAGAKMQKLGRQLTWGVSVPLAGIATAAMKMSVDFNKSMGEVATLLPKNSARVEELKKAVQSLAMETGKSTGELSAGLYELLSAFGQSADNAKKLKLHAKAAAAGLGTVKQSIDHVKAVTEAWGDSSYEMQERIANLGQKTIALGKTTLPELSQGVQKVAARAKLLGVQLDELYGQFATFTGVVGKASEVGTGFRGILKSFEAPTKKMRELMDGLSGKEFIKESGGLSKAVLKVVMESKKAGNVLQDFVTETEAQTQAVLMAGEALENLKKKTEELKNATDSINEAWKAQTEGVNKSGHSWEKLSANLQVAGQNIGDILAQKFQPLSEKLANLTKKLNESSPEFKNWAVNIAGILGIGGPIALGIGKLATLVGGAFGVGGSIPLLIAGGIGVIGGILWSGYRVFQEAFQAIADLDQVLADSWEGIKELWQKLWDAIPAYMRRKAQEVLNYLTGWAEKITQVFDTTAVEIVHQSIVPDMVDAILAHYQRLKAGTDLLIQKNAQLANSFRMAQAAGPMGFGGQQLGYGMGSQGWGFGQAPMPTGMGISAGGTPALQQQLQQARQVTPQGQGSGEGLMGAAKGAAEELSRQLEQALNAIFTKGGKVDFGQAGLQIAQSALKKLLEGVQGKLAEAFGGIFTKAGEGLILDLTSGADILTEAGTTIFDLLKDAGSFLTDVGSGMGDMLVQAGKGLGNILKSVLSAIPGIGGFLSFLPFDTGGIVKAQTGMKTQGTQLALLHDEEWVLNPGATGQLSRDYGEGAFGWLNRGELPPGGRGGAGGGVTNIIHNHFPQMDEIEADRFARRLAYSLDRHYDRDIGFE